MGLLRFGFWVEALIVTFSSNTPSKTSQTLKFNRILQMHYQMGPASSLEISGFEWVPHLGFRDSRVGFRLQDCGMSIA